MKPLSAASELFLRLDLLRFIAALGIVVYHFREALPAPALPSIGFQQLSAFVDLFFAISGIVIMHLYRSRVASAAEYGRFLWARVARLGPLHWATLLFYVALVPVAAVLGLSSSDPQRYSTDCLAPTALFLNATGVCDRLSFNYVSWSISAEMVVYLAFPIIVALGRRWSLLPGAIAVIILVALYIFESGQHGAAPWWKWTFHFGFVRALIGFLIGSSLYLMRQQLARVPFAAILVWLLVVLFFVLVAVNAPSAFLPPLMYLIAAIALGADTREKPAVWLLKSAPLGQLSYSMYMLHPLAVTILIGFVGQRLLHLQGGLWLACGFLALVTVLIASYCSALYFEAPMRALLRSQPLRAAPKSA